LLCSSRSLSPRSVSSLQPHADAQAARRVVRELLKYTRGDKAASVEHVGTYASCSTELCQQIVSELGLTVHDGLIRLSSESRLDLAMSEANRGLAQDASRFLEWRDFERFAESCLEEMSFKTERDVRMKMDGRRWQIDVIGLKGELLICVDCKHWAPPMSPSRFKNPEAHQAEATRLYAERLAKEKNSEVTALPLILTIFETHQKLPEKAVIADVQRLPSMLRDLTPYTPNMPFHIVGPE
jgi:hypothetical protein